MTVQGTVKAAGETKVMEVPWAVLPLAQMRKKQVGRRVAARRAGDVR